MWILTKAITGNAHAVYNSLLALISRVIFLHNENSMWKQNHNAGSCSINFFFEHRPNVCSVSQALKVLNIFNRTQNFTAEERFFPYEIYTEWEA